MRSNHTSFRPAPPGLMGTTPLAEATTEAPAAANPQPAAAHDPLLTLTQAAEHLNVSRGFIQDSIYKHNTLPAYKIGRNVLRVRLSDVDAMLTPIDR